MKRSHILEAFTFISDALTRLNDARAVDNNDIFMLAEELNDIQNVVDDAKTQLMEGIIKDAT